MAGADKFGNVFVTRMPADISLQVEDDPTGGKFAAVGGGTLGAADHKVEPVINFHVGDLVMSMQLTALQSGGQEVRRRVTPGAPPSKGMITCLSLAMVSLRRQFRRRVQGLLTGASACR